MIVRFNMHTQTDTDNVCVYMYNVCVHVYTHKKIMLVFSHSGVYPLFKPGSANLGGACLRAHVTLRPHAGGAQSPVSNGQARTTGTISVTCMLYCNIVLRFFVTICLISPPSLPVIRRDGRMSRASCLPFWEIGGFGPCVFEA